MQAEPFAHHLGLVPGRELSFRQLWNVLEPRIGDRVSRARPVPSERQNVAVERHRRFARDVIAHELLGVHDDVAFQIIARAERGRRAGIEIAHVQHARGRVGAAGLRGVNDRVVDHRVEISLFRRRRLIAVEKQIAEDRDLRSVARVVAS